MEHAIHNISPIYNELDSQILILREFPFWDIPASTVLLSSSTESLLEVLAALYHEDV